MKKISAVILAITAVTMISCQRETIDSGALTGEVEFTVTAGIPGGISTYADPVAAFSHNGGAVNVDPTEYDLRYILEVYTQDEDPVRVYRKTVIVPDYFTTTDVTITARLVAKTYDFVFWADFVENGSAENTDGLYYNTDPLTQVSYKDNVTLATLATEAIDAYCHVEEVDLSKNQNISGIKLHRPFGKIRLLATDKLTEGVEQGEYPAETKVDFKGVTVPASFNALTGLALDDELTVEDITGTSIWENASVAGTEYPGSYLLGYYYIFAADGNTSYAMDVTTYDQSGIQMGVRNLSQIPVQKNKLTTVIGNFYTNEGTVGIIVEDPFDGDDNIVKDNETAVAELQEAISKGGTYKLEQDIDLSQCGLDIPERISSKLDLNGKKINVANTSGGRIRVLGNLTISDNTGTGRIETTTDYTSSSGYGIIEVVGNGQLTMEGGNIYAVRQDPVNKGQFAVTLSDGGTFTMKGGRIEAGWYAVSGNGTDVTTNGVINIEGGELISVSDYAIYLPHSGVANITGGTVNGAAGAVSIRRGELNISGDAKLFSMNDGDTGDWGDGTGNQGNSGIMVYPTYGPCKVNISGGSVRSLKDAIVFNKNAAHASGSAVQISAGTFSDPTPTAFLAANADVKIVMERDFAGPGIGIYNSGNGARATLDIDMNGHMWILDNTLHGSPGTVSQNFHLEKDANITIKNGTIRPGADCNATMLFQNYSNLTLDNMTVYSCSEDGSREIPYLMSNNNGNIVIRDTKLIAKNEGAFAFDVYCFASYEGVTVTVEGESEITGRVEFGGNNGKKTGELIVEGGTFNGDLVVTPEYYDSENPNIILSGGTFNGNGWEDYK